MSGLVAYGSGSSDEEDETEIAPERPAKIPKLDDAGVQITNDAMGAQTTIAPETEIQQPINAPYAPVTQPAQPASTPLGPARAHSPPTTTADPPPGPAPAPAPATPSPNDSAPSSPYTTTRQRIHALTMPTVPNFDIPASPPPPPQTTAEATHLSTTTKKFTRFLELKQQGIHFNDRLQNSASLRNPSLLPKLMEFAGVSVEESYASSLSAEAGGVPVKWAEEVYVEGLMEANRRWEKKVRDGREKLDFVPGAGKSGGAGESGTGTVDGGRKSRFGNR